LFLTTGSSAMTDALRYRRSVYDVGGVTDSAVFVIPFTARVHRLRPDPLIDGFCRELTTCDALRSAIQRFYRPQPLTIFMEKNVDVSTSSVAEGIARRFNEMGMSFCKKGPDGGRPQQILIGIWGESTDPEYPFIRTVQSLFLIPKDIRYEKGSQHPHQTEGAPPCLDRQNSIARRESVFVDDDPFDALPSDSEDEGDSECDACERGESNVWKPLPEEPDTLQMVRTFP